MTSFGHETLLALPFSPFGLVLGTRDPSCVTVFSFWTGFGYARPFLRYRFLFLDWFWARETLLTSPFSPFGLVLGTRDPSYVTVFSFWTGFGHARPFLRYRFLFLDCFRARETLLALPFFLFGLVSGTRDSLCVTVFSSLTSFGHASPLLRYRLFFLDTLN
jgi:hypothetical protein